MTLRMPPNNFDFSFTFDLIYLIINVFMKFHGMSYLYH